MWIWILVYCALATRLNRLLDEIDDLINFDSSDEDFAQVPVGRNAESRNFVLDLFHELDQTIKNGEDELDAFYAFGDDSSEEALGVNNPSEETGPQEREIVPASGYCPVDLIKNKRCNINDGRFIELKINHARINVWFKQSMLDQSIVKCAKKCWEMPGPGCCSYTWSGDMKGDMWRAQIVPKCIWYPDVLMEDSPTMAAEPSVLNFAQTCTRSGENIWEVPYTLTTTGSCDTPIVTKAECEQAANQLGLTDTEASLIDVNAVEKLPPYCIHREEGAEWLGFNADSSSPIECGDQSMSNEHFDCICKGREEQDCVDIFIGSSRLEDTGEAVFSDLIDRTYTSIIDKTCPMSIVSGGGYEFSVQQEGSRIRVTKINADDSSSPGWDFPIKIQCCKSKTVSKAYITSNDRTSSDPFREETCFQYSERNIVNWPYKESEEVVEVVIARDGPNTISESKLIGTDVDFIMCKEACAFMVDCNFIEFRPGEGKCFLIRYSGEVSQDCDGGSLFYIKRDYIPPCHANKWYKNPRQVYKTIESIFQSAEACQEKCREFHGCKHWEFNPKGHGSSDIDAEDFSINYKSICNLYSERTLVEESREGWISGHRSCSLDLSTVGLPVHCVTGDQRKDHKCGHCTSITQCQFASELTYALTTKSALELTNPESGLLIAPGETGGSVLAQNVLVNIEGKICTITRDHDEPICGGHSAPKLITFQTVSDARDPDATDCRKGSNIFIDNPATSGDLLCDGSQVHIIGSGFLGYDLSSQPIVRKMTVIDGEVKWTDSSSIITWIIEFLDFDNGILTTNRKFFIRAVSKEDPEFTCYLRVRKKLHVYAGQGRGKFSKVVCEDLDLDSDIAQSFIWEFQVRPELVKSIPSATGYHDIISWWTNDAKIIPISKTGAYTSMLWDEEFFEANDFKDAIPWAVREFAKLLFAPLPSEAISKLVEKEVYAKMWNSMGDRIQAGYSVPYYYGDMLQQIQKDLDGENNMLKSKYKDLAGLHFVSKTQHDQEYATCSFDMDKVFNFPPKLWHDALLLDEKQQIVSKVMKTNIPFWKTFDTDANSISMLKLLTIFVQSGFFIQILYSNPLLSERRSIISHLYSLANYLQGSIPDQRNPEGCNSWWESYAENAASEKVECSLDCSETPDRPFCLMDAFVGALNTAIISGQIVYSPDEILAHSDLSHEEWKKTLYDVLKYLFCGDDVECELPKAPIGGVEAEHSVGEIILHPTGSYGDKFGDMYAHRRRLGGEHKVFVRKKVSEIKEELNQEQKSKDPYLMAFDLVGKKEGSSAMKTLFNKGEEWVDFIIDQGFQPETLMDTMSESSLEKRKMMQIYSIQNEGQPVPKRVLKFYINQEGVDNFGLCDLLFEYPETLDQQISIGGFSVMKAIMASYIIASKSESWSTITEKDKTRVLNIFVHTIKTTASLANDYNLQHVLKIQDPSPDTFKGFITLENRIGQYLLHLDYASDSFPFGLLDHYDDLLDRSTQRTEYSFPGNAMETVYMHSSLMESLFPLYAFSSQLTNTGFELLQEITEEPEEKHGSTDGSMQIQRHLAAGISLLGRERISGPGIIGGSLPFTNSMRLFLPQEMDLNYKDSETQLCQILACNGLTSSVECHAH